MHPSIVRLFLDVQPMRMRVCWHYGSAGLCSLQDHPAGIAGHQPQCWSLACQDHPHLPKPLERRERNRESDARRRQSKPWRAWYGTARWQAKRAAQLKAHPLCQRCEENKRIVAATVAHHKVRHNGDAQLFWFGELASSCADCHDTIEQRIEAKGFDIGSDVDGRPIDASHPWNLKSK